MARLLGIDATKTTVRVALLRTSYRTITLEALGEADVASAGSEIEAIRAAVGLAKPDATAIALSGERSYFRLLELPGTAQKEIANVLGYELESTVPFEMEDAVFDYRVLKRAPGTATKDDTIPIFAALALTEDVRQRLAPVREALGVEAERVATGPLALANLAMVMPELEKPETLGGGMMDAPIGPGPIAVLDVSETVSEVLILLGGEAVFARTLSRGTTGLPENAPTLARELRQTFAAWRSNGGDPLVGMILTGAGASAPGAELFLSTELGVAVFPLPRPRMLGLLPEHDIPRFAKALGLALGLHGRARGLNLRQGALEPERRYPFLREKVPILSGLVATIALSFGFSIVAEMRSLDAEREVLIARLGAASRDVLGEETTDPAHAHELLDQGPIKGDEDPLPRADAFDVMVALSKAVPMEMVHDVLEFDIARGHAAIQGVVPTVADAETIVKNMKDNKCFKDVKISRTSQFAELKQKYVLEFEIKREDRKKDKDKSSAPKASAEPADSAAPAASGAVKPEGGK